MSAENSIDWRTEKLLQIRHLSLNTIGDNKYTNQIQLYQVNIFKHLELIAEMF